MWHLQTALADGRVGEQRKKQVTGLSSGQDTARDEPEPRSGKQQQPRDAQLQPDGDVFVVRGVKRTGYAGAVAEDGGV